MTASIEPGFATDFLSTLTAHRTSLTSWISSEKSHIDQIVHELSAIHDESQSQIDALTRRLNDVRSQRGMVGDNSGGVAQQKAALEEKQVKLESELKEWHEKNQAGQIQLDELLDQQTHHLSLANATRMKKMQLQEMKNTTLEDLTKGLLNYEYLGLKFKRVGREGILLFTFTKLNKHNPLHPFSFVLNLNIEGKYELSSVNPPLEQTKTDELVDVLNADSDNGFMYFFVGMRKLFLETLV